MRDNDYLYLYKMFIIIFYIEMKCYIIQYIINYNIYVWYVIHLMFNFYNTL